MKIPRRKLLHLAAGAVALTTVPRFDGRCAGSLQLLLAEGMTSSRA